MSAVFLFAIACSQPEKHPPEGEGFAELDPGPSSDPDEGDTGDPGDPPDDGGDTGIEPEESDQEVCYPGQADDYTACFPLVNYTESMGASYEYPEPYEGSEQYLAPTRFLDLQVADHGVGLAPNFDLGEFMHVDKGRFGFFQVHAAESLQAIRDASGGPLYVNSGYRNVTYNEGVGGATWSRHMYGDAVDMYSDVLSLSELGALCDDLHAGFVKYYDTHVHCDWRDDPLDEHFFE